MTDKEFRHLSRSELMDIIYTLRKNQETLERMNANLKERLASRELKIANAGSIAEAALAVNKIFERAQEAADLYLEQVKRLNENPEEHVRLAREQAAEIIRQAEAEAARIRARAEAGDPEEDGEETGAETTPSPEETQSSPSGEQPAEAEPASTWELVEHEKKE